jgi:hypothetical protein
LEESRVGTFVLNKRKISKVLNRGMHGPSCLGVTGNDDSASYTFGSWNTSLFAAGLIAVSVKSLFKIPT